MHYLLHEEDWWAAWRAEDFSWEGLAKKALYGWCVDRNGRLTPEVDRSDLPRATLQDLWRAEEDNLIPELDVSGRVLRHWTPAHLPLSFDDGTPAKSVWSVDQWEELETIISARVQELKLLNGKVRIEGAVLYRFIDDSASDGTVEFIRCFFRGQLRKAFTSEKITAFNCVFSDTFDISGSTFFRGASLERCLFRSSAWFHGVSFGGRADFTGSRFESEVGFHEARSTRLWLPQTEIIGPLRFEKSQHDLINLGDSRLADVRADHSRGESISFERCSLAALDLTSSEFDRIYLRSATIEREIVLNGMEARSWYVNNLKVAGDVNFQRVVVRGLGDFEGLECGGKLDFRSAKLQGEINFGNLRVAGPAIFRNAVWPPGLLLNLFRGATFAGFIDFRGETPPSLAGFEAVKLGGEARCRGSLTPRVDRSLVRGLARAHGLVRTARATPNLRIEDMGKSEGAAPSYIRRLSRLAFLAPDIQQALVNGQQPLGVNLERLMRIDLPLSWQRQRELLGFDHN